MKHFEFTQEHRLLLQNAYVRWEDCEFGAPAIDCKRPYGNSDVLYDISEILGYGAYNEENRDKFITLHYELKTALQILLQEGSYLLGTYITNKEGHWEYQEDVG